MLGRARLLLVFIIGLMAVLIVNNWWPVKPMLLAPSVNSSSAAVQEPVPIVNQIKLETKYSIITSNEAPIM